MKIFTNIRALILVFFLSIICVSSTNYSISDDPRVDKIIRQFNLFRSKCDQQKVYLHTDRDEYMAGEPIWIKSYVLDAATLLPDTISKDVYVELLNMNNQSVASIILRSKQGFSNGNIQLRDTILEGNYQIRAYTNWMRNFDKDFFYYKTISVKNPNYENVITKPRLKDIKRFNRIMKRKENDYVVNFFPEGGTLVQGIASNIAFKAETSLGTPLKVSGTVFDNKGNEVATFKDTHDGMGVFKLTPQPKTKYTAKVIFENGKKSNFSLPQAAPKGFVMTVDPYEKKEIRVFVEANRDVSNNIASNEVIVVGQSRGIITYVSKGEVLDKPVISNISKKLFPSGVAQITLFNGRGEPVCERLVFIDQQVENSANKVDISTTNKGDSVLVNVKMTKPDGTPVNGNFSMSVVENLENTNNSAKENILTNLLLTSDLKGRINDPSYYFENNPDANKHLDLVMMTHGWRRFVWKELLANKLPETPNQKPGGISINGRITRDFFGIPISDSKVILSILNTYNDKFVTITDSKGKFEFPIMDYEDTINVKIEATKPSGGKAVQIILGDTLVPDITTLTYPAFLNESFEKRKMRLNARKEYIEKRKIPAPPKEEENLPGRIYDTPSNVLKVKDDANTYSTITQYMQGRIPGVQVIGDRIIIRGISTILGSTDPLYLLDGVPIGANSLSSLNPMDIDRIEVLKGPEASIYGSQGANGVVAFYSKRGHFMKRGVIEFGMLGYHKAREFYVPPYDSWKYKPSDYKIRRTIFWGPNVSTDAKGEAIVRFKKTFATEKFGLTMEGVTTAGDVIYSTLAN